MQQRFLLILLLLLQQSTGFAQNVTIKGIAPAYVGKSIELYSIQDYITYRLKRIATTQVKEDSTFIFLADVPITQKLIIKSNNNSGFMYVQPGSKYSVFFPEKDKFDPYKRNGNQVEVAFYDLDSTDINYKILGFQRWVDHFIGNYYYLKDAKPIEFAESMDRFKANVEKAYKDDTSTYLKTFVRFTIASLDNIQNIAQRNRYEKHDFYIKHTPVQYNNDAYMEYITDFYQNLIPRLKSEVNEEVYQGILRGSPTLIMNALGKEYTLINVRIREMMMVKALADVYYSDDYPQTNILTIMDSISEHALFEANKVIASNLKFRLTELVPGGKATNFVFKMDDKTVTLQSFQGKHLYIHVFDPEILDNTKELELLNDIYERYGNYIQFVSICKKTDETSKERTELLASIPWDVYELDPDNSFWDNYRISSTPHYVLIDATGHVVASPALGPTPNGQYETIDKTFFHIRKSIEGSR